MWEAVGLQGYSNHNENDYALHSIKFHARALFLHPIQYMAALLLSYITLLLLILRKLDIFSEMKIPFFLG
jgi:hypothetical protein